MKISVCIPMYNENRVIAKTAQELSSYMQANYEDYEILFCSDGSRDGCDQTVRDLALPNVRVIAYEQNRGKGCAVRTAMLEACGEIRIFTDADLAYGTGCIKQITDAFAAAPDSDLVIGSRNLDREGYASYTWARRVASKAYLRVLCLVGGFRLSDSQCGCKAFRGEAAEKIFSRCEVNGFAFDFEAIMIATRMKLSIGELAVKVINHRESKVHVFSDAFRMLGDLHRMKKRVKKLEI